jgi:predicted transcriptional regulator
MRTRVLTVHIPLPLAQKVEKLAGRLGRSRGWIVNQALASWLEREEAQYRLTLEALADVDVGRVTDHQAVQTWADGLSELMRTSLRRSRPGRA